MAHEIDMSNGRANMAYVGEVPWHRLGQRLEEGAPISEWLTAAGMAWVVKRTPIVYRDDKDVERTFDDKHVLYRSDTGLPLSAMSKGYKIVQPMEVMEVFDKLCNEFSMKMETAGCLKGGAIYWGLAKTDRVSEIVKGDKVGSYVLLSTSVDGTQATTARHTGVRVVCMNTMRVAVSGKANYRKKHRSEFSYNDMAQELGLIRFDEEWAQFEESMNRLGSVPVSGGQAITFYKEVLRPRVTKLEDIKWANLEAAHVQREEQEREVKGLSTLVDSYNNAPGAAPGTLYGLLQGVTHYIDHGRNKGDDDGRMTSAWFGSGASTKDRAHEMCGVLAQ